MHCNSCIHSNAMHCTWGLPSTYTFHHAHCTYMRSAGSGYHLATHHCCQFSWHFDLLVLLVVVLVLLVYVCRQWIVLTAVYCKHLLFNTHWNSSTLFTMHIGGKVPLSVQNSHIDLLLLLVCLCYLTLVVLPSMPVHLCKLTGVVLSSQLKPIASHLINQTVHYKIGFSFWKRSFGIWN